MTSVCRTHSVECQDSRLIRRNLKGRRRDLIETLPRNLPAGNEKRCLDSRLTDGDKVVSLTHGPLFIPQRDLLVLISARG
jgi:hypothetical protein